MAVPKAEDKRSLLKPSRELKGDQPFAGASGPEGSAFLGWVLVQVWQPTPTNSGVTMNFSGDQVVVSRAADALASFAARLKAMPPQV